MSFPTVRMRRLRRTAALREMLNQVTLQPSNLIYPIFVEEGIKKPVPIGSMPGYSRLPISQVAEEGKARLGAGRQKRAPIRHSSQKRRRRHRCIRQRRHRPESHPQTQKSLRRRTRCHRRRLPLRIHEPRSLRHSQRRRSPKRPHP